MHGVPYFQYVFQVPSGSRYAVPVQVTPFSICYVPLDVAAWRDLKTVQLMNRGGNAVAATIHSITLALAEFGGSFDDRNSVSLLDASSSFGACIDDTMVNW